MEMTSFILFLTGAGGGVGVSQFILGGIKYGLSSVVFLLTIFFFFLILLREKQEKVPPLLQAEGKSKKWIKKKADSLEAEGEYKGAGDLYLKLGDYEKAAKLYIQGRALGKAGEIFIKLNELDKAALAFEKRGLWEKAGKYYEEIGNLEKSAYAYRMAGDYLESARKYEKGGFFRQAAEIYKNMKNYRKAGEMLYRAGDKLGAAQALEEALKVASSRLPEDMSPSESRMLSNLSFMIGQFYAQEGRNEESASAYESGGHFAEAAAIHEQLGRYSLAGQLYLKAGEPFKAAIALEKMGQKEQAALVRAEAYKQRGHYLEAVGYYEIAGKFEEAGELYAQLGDYPKSARMLERAGKFRESAEKYLLAKELDLAASALEKAGDFERAAQVYKEAGNELKMAQMLSLAKRFLEAGEVFYRNGHVESAIKALQQIPEEAPDYERALILLGDIFREKGIHKIALQHYQRALTGKKVDRSNLSAMYNMALTLEALGRFAEALEIYESIIVVDYHYADTADRVRALQQRVIALTTPSTPSELRVTTPASGDTTLLSDAMPTQVGISVPRERRYEIIEEIGRGGMGIVYKARDTVLDRIVAYKILPASLKEHPQAIKNFFREAKSAAALNHPNIVTVYDAGEEEGNYYIAMEYLKGRTLKQILNRDGRLPLKNMLLVCGQICRALIYAHNKKIVHRDIKSSNIMVTEDQVIKLMDFGLAKVIEEVKGSQTIASGTPYYMSPEQTLGKAIDHRTDIYSLGVTMFEMATGILPFMDGEAAYHHVHTPPPDPVTVVPDIHPIISTIILKAMEKDPDRRYQTASELLEDLRKLAKEVFKGTDSGFEGAGV